MSDHGTLTVQVRSTHGKGAARRLRAQGLVPGVVYGQGADNISIQLDPRQLMRAMDPELRYNTLFSVTVQADGQPDQTFECVLSDWDRHPTRDTLLHVDFLRIDPKAEVERMIPVRFEGRAAGVVMGGKLETYRRKVRVRAPAGAVPPALVVDVTPLEAGAFLRMEDVALEGATLMEPPRQALAHVKPPKVSKADKDAEDKKK